MVPLLSSAEFLGQRFATLLTNVKWSIPLYDLIFSIKIYIFIEL